MEKFRNIEYPYKNENDTFIIRGLQANQLVDAVNNLGDGAVGATDTIIYIATAEVLYSNTNQTTIITLPADAIIWDIDVEVITAFTGTGTDLLDIGINGEVDRYEADLDISATGFKTMTLTEIPERFAGGTNVVFQYADANADAGAGQAYIHIRYSRH